MSKKYIPYLINPFKLLSYALWKYCHPIPCGLVFINFIFQRLLKINNEYNFPVNFTSRIVGDIDIGKDVWISFAVSGGCYIQANNGLKIGDRTIFAPGVKIISANHKSGELSKWTKSDPIVIGDDVWIGANAIILPGVQIGNNTIVGAGAVVTRSIPSNSIVVGNPAKLLKKK